MLIVIGCAKAGTSSLTNMLATHPMFQRGTYKEARAFCDLGSINWSGPGVEGFWKGQVSGVEGLVGNYPGLPDGHWAIDASTDYIWFPGARDAMQAYAETTDMKLICVVRDPIKRAISEYNHTLRQGWETLSFKAALEAEEQRITEGYIPLFYHQRRSRIYDDLSAFRAAFPDRLLVLDYQALKTPQKVMDDICDFVGVDSHPVELQDRMNETYLPRNRLAKLVTRGRYLNAVARRVVPGALKDRVRGALYRNSRDLVTVQADEIRYLRAELADEIRNCIACPFIPTENWDIEDI